MYERNVKSDQDSIQIQQPGVTVLPLSFSTFGQSFIHKVIHQTSNSVSEPERVHWQHSLGWRDGVTLSPVNQSDTNQLWAFVS